MNISNKFVRKLKLILIVCIIFYVISILAVYYEGRKKKRQEGTKKSLQQGFGYYTDEESLGCFSPSGKCTDAGTETTVQYCRPHPSTGRGCIDENGKQSYSTIIKKRQCKTQCVSSKFTVEEGLRVGNPRTSYLGTCVTPNIISSGCDNIIDKKFGLDVKDNFLGKFNKDIYKYELKTCIPTGPTSKFQGYYQRVSTCVPSDGKGSNNCTIICGRDRNILNLNGFTNAKLNKKLLSYFPTEIDEEGNIRNICYDINNVDQIERLNYPGKIPEDFIYPNKCYKHSNVYNFTEPIWPSFGASNTFGLSTINVSKDVPYIDLIGDNSQKFQNSIGDKIINGNYDLSNNQNSYVKIRLGNSISLLDKIYPKIDTSGSVRSSSNIPENLYYIYFSGVTQSDTNGLLEFLTNPSSDFSKFVDTNDTTNKIFTNTSFFQNNSKAFTGKYFIKDGNQSIMFPCDVNDFFNSYTGNFRMTKIDATSSSDYYLFSDTDILLGGSSFPTQLYIVFKDSKGTEIHYSHNFSIHKGASSVGNAFVFELQSTNPYPINLEDVSITKVYVGESASGSAYKGFRTNVRLMLTSTNHLSFKVNYDFSFITSVFTKKLFDTTASYNHLEIKNQYKNLRGVDGGACAYSIFATSPLNNCIGYNYPVYLTRQKPSDVKVFFSEFPNVSFYTPPGSSLPGVGTNFYYNEKYVNNTELLFFNNEILTSCVNYTNNGISINGSKKYFLSGLTPINVGTSYVDGEFYGLYSNEFSPGYDLRNTALATDTSGVSPTAGIIYNKDTSSSPVDLTRLKLINGSTPIVNTGLNTNLTDTQGQEKVRDYFKMISHQTINPDDLTIKLVIEPEKHMSLAADYSVFKSPYIETSQEKIFLCYDSTGRARPEGYKTQIPTNGSKVFTNLTCPDKKVTYEVDSDNGPFCGVKGIEDENNPGYLNYCIQQRDSKAVNFSETDVAEKENSCLITKNESEYQTLNNQLEFGLDLVPIQKALSFIGTSPGPASLINNKLNGYPSYFTKILETNKSYGPGEEFFIEKSRINYFVSLVNDNIKFVDNVANWRRVFTFQNSILVSPYQYFFDVFPEESVPNTLNVSLGRYTDTFENLVLNKSSDLSISFVTDTPGTAVQNYLNQGIEYFWGSSRKRSNGCQNGGTRCGPNDPGTTGSTTDKMDTSFLQNLRGSLYRNEYNSPLFTKTPATNIQPGPWFSEKPNYTGIDVTLPSNPASTVYPNIDTHSPIYATFDIISDGEYKFISRLFDSNIGIPWAFTSNVNDYFNPDFIYFNNFIYKFILSQGAMPDTKGGIQGYGNPGTTPVPDLLNNFIVAPNPGAIPDYTDIFAIENVQPGGTIFVIPGLKDSSTTYNTPKIGDYIMLIPYRFSPSTDITNFVISPTFPYHYPTIEIRRIKDLKSIDDGSGHYTMVFEDKSYSGAKAYNSVVDKMSCYLFNLGNASLENNLVTRTFKIKDISQLITVPGTSQGNPLPGVPVIRNYLEFEFTIQSISQQTMKELYDLNENRKISQYSIKTSTVTLKGHNGQDCYNNQVFTSSNSTSDWPGFDPSKETVCFGFGCMAGDAPADASCVSNLDDGGHYAGWLFGNCPNPKWWSCGKGPNATAIETSSTNVENNIFNGGNFLTPALSARYIKATVQAPHQSTKRGNTCATLYNPDGQSILNTRVISLTTDISWNLEGNEKLYYIREFREDSNYFVQQFPRTFSVGDTFDYYMSQISEDVILSGNKNFKNIASFRVKKVGVTVEIGGSNSGCFSDYDYVCELISPSSASDFKNNFFTKDTPVTTEQRTGIYSTHSHGTSWYRKIPYTINSPLTTVNPDGSGRTDVGTVGEARRAAFLYYTEKDFKDVHVHGHTGPLYIFEILDFPGTGNNIEYIISETYNNFYLDYYKLPSISGSNKFDELNRNNITVSGDALRAGIVDTMVLTGTNMVSDIGQKAFANVKVSGKPAGVGFFPSSPGTSNAMVDYRGFGKIESFQLENSGTTMPLNTVLKSKNGFAIKFIDTVPPIYTFKNIEAPTREISRYDENFTYAASEIVNVGDKNLRQYLRNTSDVAIPYMSKIDIKNPYIPFAISHKSGTWLYPVYKYNIPGTSLVPGITPTVYAMPETFELNSKTNTTKYITYTTSNNDLKNILNSFKIVSETLYTEDNYTIYNPGSYYGLGDIVRFGDELYRSLFPRNNNILPGLSWQKLELTKNLSSMKENNFYTEFKQNKTDFSKIIREIRSLNNQVLPALLKYNFNIPGSEPRPSVDSNEFCPKPCTFYSIDNNTGGTFLASNYYKDISYLFKSPVMVKKNKGVSPFISLGNTPVGKSITYNTGFLQNGGARSDFLSQYLYLINIKDQEDKYNRSSCTGGLSITTSSGLCSTEANKFEFANSMLFNFLPCNEDGQDFIKYDVNPDMSTGTSFLVSSLPEYPSSSTPNIFPDPGASCHVLISSKKGTCFTRSYGHFEYSFCDFDSLATNEITLTGPEPSGTSTVTISNITRESFLFTIDSSTTLSYGDTWYIPGDPNSAPFGFVIPRNDGKKTQRSFMQLNRGTDYTNAVNIKTIRENALPETFNSGHANRPQTFTISNNTSKPGTTTGRYKHVDGTVDASYFIQFNGPDILQIGKAIFRGDNPVDGAENIYLPTYDITQNIKAQAVTVFGENFSGNLTYTLDSNNANYSLDGTKSATMVFNELRNDLLLNDSEKKKKEIFIGNKTIDTDNNYKTFIINFKPDGTFKIMPNLFGNPILSPTNKFLYSPETSVDPTKPIGVVNTESTTVLISENLESLKGVSVNIDFEDFLKFNREYTPGACIPGKTNVQIQLNEIRQNTTDDYIDESNKCSIYFKPIVGTTAKSVSEATWNIKIQNKRAYPPNTAYVNRFAGNFTNTTDLNYNSKTTFFLGCNLIYIFDQSDKTNKEPIIFSKNNPFDSFDGSPISLNGGSDFVTQYFIDSEKVKYDDYKLLFASASTRSVEILCKGSYGLSVPNYSDAFIYYGPLSSNTANTGGRIKFDYH